MHDLRVLLHLTGVEMKLAFRVRIAFFFTFLFPLLLFFLYTYVFGRGDPEAVPYMMGPLIVMVVVGNTLYGVSNMLVTSRSTGVFLVYRLSPARPSHLVLAKTLSALLLLFPVVLSQFVLARILFRFAVDVPVLPLVVILAVTSLSISALGTLVATLTDTPASAQVVNQILFLLLVFLSGATIPLPMLPLGIQKMSCFIPTSHLVRMLQGLLTGEATGLLAFWKELSVLGASTLLWLGISFRLFRWDPGVPLSATHRLLSLASLLPLGLFGLHLLGRMR